MSARMYPVKSRARTEVAVLLLFVLVLCVQAFYPRPLGLANNGDFPKVLGRIRIWPKIPNEEFKFLRTDYRIDPAYSWNSHIPSVEVWCAKAAKRLSALIIGTSHFDLRYLGTIHGLILTLAIWVMLLSSREINGYRFAAFAVPVIFVYADVAYVEFLNTAYMDAGSIYLLLLLFGIALLVCLRPCESDWKKPLLFGCCAALFLGTKMQHQPCILPLIIFSLVLLVRSRHRKVIASWAAAILLMIGSTLIMRAEMPQDYQAESLFSLVFLKLVPLSPHPAAALSELRRPPTDLAYVGMNAWSTGSPLPNSAYRDKFWHDVNTQTVLRYYLHHPALAAYILWQDLKIAGTDVPVSEIEVGVDNYFQYTKYGVYRQSDDPRPHARPTGLILQLWSSLRRWVAVAAPWLFPLLFLVVFPVSIWRSVTTRVRDNGVTSWPLLALITGIGGTAFLTGSLADATDTSRHTVIYQVSIDFGCLYLWHCSLRHRQEKRLAKFLAAGHKPEIHAPVQVGSDLLL